MIYLKLFLSFLQIGLFSIGGGYAAMPIIQNEIVEHQGWITMSEYSDLITIAEMTPGPIAVNSATFVGNHIAGLPGAIAATFGCIFPACIICSALYFIYRRYKNVSLLQSILGSLRPVIVALIASAGLNILLLSVTGISTLSAEILNIHNINYIELFIFIAAFIILRKAKCSPIPVMLLGGILGLGLHLMFT
jgi:chromate transporter